MQYMPAELSTGQLLKAAFSVSTETSVTSTGVVLLVESVTGKKKKKSSTKLRILTS